MEFIYFGTDRLEQGCYDDCFADGERNVADAKLQRREKRVRAHVPVNFLGVVDAVHLDQQIDVGLKLLVRFEMVGDVGARKFFEHLGAIGF